MEGATLKLRSTGTIGAHSGAETGAAFEGFNQFVVCIGKCHIRVVLLLVTFILQRSSEILLALEEVLTNHNTYQTHTDGRNTDETTKESESFITRLSAGYEGNQKSNDCEDENYDVVHDYIIAEFCVVLAVSTYQSVG